MRDTLRLWDQHRLRQAWVDWQLCFSRLGFELNESYRARSGSSVRQAEPVAFVFAVPKNPGNQPLNTIPNILSVIFELLLAS